MSALRKIAIALATLSLALAVPTPSGPEAEVIEGSYIIKLKDDASDLKSHMSWVEEVHARRVKRDVDGIDVTIDLDGFHGYTGHFDEATIAEIENNDEVAYVEKNQKWTVMEAETLHRRALTTQNNAIYGLASISNRRPGATQYIYEDSAGQGTYAYVVDTGVRTSHREFQGRATNGFSVFPDTNIDYDGHGTHVAATIAGVTYGVAKKANVIAVKVFRGREGTTADVMKGYEWTINDIVNKKRQNTAVVNMSLGGGVSRAFNDLVAAASSRGIVTVVAAGNDLKDASNYSPASAPSAITVGAVDAQWNLARGWFDPNTGIEYGSNWGPTLDIFAPGDEILSAGIASDSQAVYKSGTSMATPHVAGLALFVLSVDGVTGPQNVRDRLVANSGKNVIGGQLNGSPNRMANNGRP